jgi:ribonuclease Z
VSFRIAGLVIALLVGVFSWMLTCAAWQFDQVAAGVIPLDPRSFERLTLVTLGTAGAAEDHNRRGTSIAVGVGERVVLVDAGRGVAEALRAASIPVSQPEAVLLTNLLPENTVGLDDLLAAAWLGGRREALRLVGPPGSAALAKATVAAVSPGVVARAVALGDDSAPPAFSVTEVASDWKEPLGDLSLSAAPLPGGPLPALAWRLEAKGRSAVVGGTGWSGEALERFARGAQLLVHDAGFVPTPEEAEELGLEEDPERLRREAALLTHLDDVGAIARRAGVGALVLVRLRPPPVYDLQITMRVDDSFDGRIAVAQDGDEFVP